MSQSPSLSDPLLAEPAYPRLKDHLIRKTGLAYFADKDADLLERVTRRLAVLGLHNCDSYLAFLQSSSQGEAELDTLIESLTIGETFFFRHREMFDALRDVVLPDIIARNQQRRRIRIWSAGCSNGAEPYSVSILLRRELAAQVAGWDVSIVGTDINRDFLARARDGRFEEWALRTSSDEFKRGCFDRSGNFWLLKPAFKEGVSFQYHNLVAHSFPSLLHDLSDFDLILCRNVTIYFSQDIVRPIIEHFHRSLAQYGWLAVGHAEPNLELFRSFRTVNAAGAVLYQKSSTSGLPQALPPAPMAISPWLPWVFETPAVSSEELSHHLPDAIGPGAVAANDSPSASTILDTIRALANGGDWGNAARRCDELLHRDNLNTAAHFYRGLVHEQMGQHAEAESSLRRVIYLDRNHVLAHYYLGLLLQRQGRFPQAVRSFQNVRQLLSRVDPARIFEDGDGITASELGKLTEMQLEVLEGA